jgi:2-polyprenyl-3-methyl-5-hydroxy-6-metoxy-1,4-benzoquinol methylase
VAEKRGRAVSTPQFAGRVIPCPLCSATDLTTVSERDRNGGALTTALCRDCGHVFTNPQPTQDELDAYYARSYRASYKKVTAPKNKHVYRAGLRALERLERLAPHVRDGASVLDIGAGGGEFVYLLTREGYAATGLEPNLGYAEHARTSYGIDIAVGTIEQNFPDAGAWDAITLHHVLEHLSNPVETLKRLGRGLRPTGVIIVEVPNVGANYHAPQRQFHFAHLHTFSADGLTHAAAQAGLSVSDLAVQPHTGHLNAVLKAGPSAVPLIKPGTAEKIERTLRNSSALHDHLSPRPYRRLWANALRPIRERLALKRLGGPKTPRDILDRLFESRD